ncbi:hypothetical protein DNH61_10215 [Paenibacillus sambharensis]|uniref:Uncharacterized protein n=1 Tax=Paenibacillus sambharensis TaxID=1803190 RepID=A0A2W1L6K0_9BACL|nr:hypothetical protein [Paenibacillus sambharensis]PZD95818.1 hypothetical protein DNH61_10215 [Paenibacillus sambharensis]
MASGASGCGAGRQSSQSTVLDVTRRGQPEEQAGEVPGARCPASHGDASGKRRHFAGQKPAILQVFYDRS